MGDVDSKKMNKSIIFHSFLIAFLNNENFFSLLSIWSCCSTFVPLGRRWQSETSFFSDLISSPSVVLSHRATSAVFISFFMATFLLSSLESLRKKILMRTKTRLAHFASSSLRGKTDDDDDDDGGQQGRVVVIWSHLFDLLTLPFVRSSVELARLNPHSPTTSYTAAQHQLFQHQGRERFNFADRISSD